MMITERLSVLAIEDDEEDAIILRRTLEQVPKFVFAFEQAVSWPQAQELLECVDVDIIFLDYMLGKDTGLSALEELRGSGDIRPIIALTGQGDEYVVRALLRWGADDYLSKAEMSPDVLRRSIENAMNQFHKRRLEAVNAKLVNDLQAQNEELSIKNKRLADLYNMAHEFVDNVSHEFRTPLTVIKEFTSILNDGLVGKLTEEQKTYLRTVLDRVDDLAMMIDDMLDTSKLEAGLLGVARRECTVDEVLKHVRNTLDRKAAAEGVGLAYRVDRDLPAIYCDPEKIGRVIINLTINALKFSPSNTEVLLSVDREPGGAALRFSIEDNGPGIEPEKLSELFERFRQLGGDVRSSTKGFGLGLNIARELVHLNFGEVNVSSEVGKGSTFSFTVPVNEPVRLIHSYLGRIEVLRNGATHVALVQAGVHKLLSEADSGDVERFLQHQVRKSDLVFRRSPNSWLIVTAGSRDDGRACTQRVVRAQKEANRNRPGKLLPELDLAQIGHWPVPRESSSFVTALQETLSSTEIAHVT